MTASQSVQRTLRQRRKRQAERRLRALVTVAITLGVVYVGTLIVDDPLGKLTSILAPADASGDARQDPPPSTEVPAPEAPVPDGVTQDPTRPHVDAAAASAQLATLPVKGRAPKTGYGRESQFGQPWYDLDRNGCNTRNDVLARDLTVTQLASNGCVVLAGSFIDPYTGVAMQFQHGEATSPLVQIDHVVALSDAWQKGAQQISAEQRLALANDPLNLLAVDGPTNSSKGDSDAASWLPPNHAFRCEYVSRQIAVKARYGLWVTDAERNTMAEVLTGCGA
ncbi:HNH endonuclease family protein [Leucobacter sp. cx-169]|uniref:HNH endonuclease family protein n=1 Tax=unclassified Leucobacter TaxID=2621730 RepID=UPI001CB6D490